jgi:hypothetical protein
VSEFRARIAHIRMKNGGAAVRVIDRKPLNYEDEDWRGHLLANARKIAEQTEEDNPIVGYVILGLQESGAFQMGWRYDWDRATVPRMLFPAWIAELIRRDMIMEDVATDKFNEMFEWQDGPTG